MDNLFALFDAVGLGPTGGLLLIGGLIAAISMSGKASGRSSGRRGRAKRWEFEAEFRDETRREIGEFEISLRRFRADEAFRLVASCHLRHPGLRVGAPVEVRIGETAVLRGQVSEAGFVRLRDDARVVEKLEDPSVGDRCVVRCGEAELAEARLERD